MSATVEITVKGKEEDVQKLWDALSEWNEYCGGIELDRESIRSVDGTYVPCWEAKGEMENMPDDDDSYDAFITLFADFPSLCFFISYYSYDEDKAGHCCSVFATDDDDRISSEIYKGDVEEMKENSKAYKDNWFKALQYVPEELKTKEICLAALQQDDWAFGYVPEEFKTQEICLAAVQKSGNAIEYVPEKLKTQEICLTAVQQDEDALEYVPEKLKKQVLAETKKPAAKKPAKKKTGKK